MSFCNINLRFILCLLVGVYQQTSKLNSIGPSISSSFGQNFQVKNQCLVGHVTKLHDAREIKKSKIRQRN